MARAPRGNLVPLDPNVFLNDPAFVAMSDTARGCYFMLFCAGWDLPDPGVFPEDDVARLAMTTPEIWASVRDQVMGAFEIRPGFWVHRHIAETMAGFTSVVGGDQ